MKEFMKKFKFGKTDFNIGVERECFLTNTKGNIIPVAKYVLNCLPKNNKFGHELSACQLEERVSAISLYGIEADLKENDMMLSNLESKLALKRSYTSVAPINMPLDVYPDERYLDIAKCMSKKKLSAACRVAGTHIHIKMNTAEQALRVYNGVIKHTDELIEMGDNSNGKRMNLYQIVEHNWQPPPIKDWQDFMRKAIANKYYENPRNNWSIIRISVCGTIEFRCFGSTPIMKEIIGWANICQELCEKYR